MDLAQTGHSLGSWAMRHPLLSVLLLAGVVVGIERLVVTDQEAIEEVGSALARTASEGNWEAFERLLHPDFQFESRNRAEAITHLRQLVDKYRPVGVDVSIYGLEIEGEGARGYGRIRARVAGRRQRIRINVSFTKTETGDWRLSKVERDAS